LDGTDPFEEQLFSLAHEVAHFLHDYLRPRNIAIRALGPSIEEVLNGERAPSASERLAGVLRGVALGTYAHLGRRSADGDIEDVDVLHIENKADQLALELLAPLASVVASIRQRLPTHKRLDQDTISSLLCERYGLPTDVATVYSRTVLSAIRSGRSFREWLGV
jgi:Zn-dependent peptidase ImmA (M78 family)